MALELFKPFVMKRLVELEYAANIKAAKRAVDRGASYVWDVLEEVITGRLPNERAELLAFAAKFSAS